jgi:hypothetical protein
MLNEESEDVLGDHNHILLSTVLRRCHMSDQGRQAAKVAALVAGGAVIGAGIGLLFAPQTGSETRRDLNRYAKKAQVQATRWGRAMQSGVKEVMDRSKHFVQNREHRHRIEAA